MAAEVGVLSAVRFKLPTNKLSSPSTPPFPPHALAIHNKRSHGFRVSANLGGGGEGDAKKEKKKFITKEQEPEQPRKGKSSDFPNRRGTKRGSNTLPSNHRSWYWQTAGEREGENPMKTPLPYIIIFGMSTPFVILAFGFANGWIKVPIR